MVGSLGKWWGYLVVACGVRIVSLCDFFSLIYYNAAYRPKIVFFLCCHLYEVDHSLSPSMLFITHGTIQ
jgi:hypothetical protein